MKTSSARTSPRATEKLRVVAPDPKAHSAQMFDLIAKVFSRGNGYFFFHDYTRDQYIGHSHYDWKASRIGLIGDTIVTHFGVWDYQTRVGGAAALRTGGIGVVSTHPDYRKRGYMEQTVLASIDAMRRLGYDITILFGIRDFYHRFGYTRAWSDERCTIDIKDLPHEKPPRYFEMAVAPGARTDGMYNRSHATLTGTAVRPTFRAAPFPGHVGYKRTGWGASRRRPDGYVLHWIDGQSLHCCESCGDAETALRVLRDVATTNQCAKVIFDTIPHDTDLSRKLRLSHAEYTRFQHRSGGAMIRVINLPQALSKLSPEFSKRLRQSALRDWRGQLVVRNAEQSATLSIDRAEVAVSTTPARSAHQILGGDEVAQLLIGSDDPREISATYRTRCTGDATALLPALFPPQHPALNLADRY